MKDRNNIDLDCGDIEEDDQIYDNEGHEIQIDSIV